MPEGGQAAQLCLPCQQKSRYFFGDLVRYGSFLVRVTAQGHPCGYAAHLSSCAPHVLPYPGTARMLKGTRTEEI